MKAARQLAVVIPLPTRAAVALARIRDMAHPCTDAEDALAATIATNYLAEVVMRLGVPSQKEACRALVAVITEHVAAATPLAPVVASIVPVRRRRAGGAQ